jgi:hypothetical protein
MDMGPVSSMVPMASAHRLQLPCPVQSSSSSSAPPNARTWTRLGLVPHHFRMVVNPTLPWFAIAMLLSPQSHFRPKQFTARRRRHAGQNHLHAH